MNNQSMIQLYENCKIRSLWVAEEEKWYFSIVDVCAVLTDQPTPRSASNYWAKLKQRLKEEGANELLTKCQQFKMKALDGKMRMTDTADTEQLLRIIQSIPSPKAEPFKRWLAMVGAERIDETIDPELAIDRALRSFALSAGLASGRCSKKTTSALTGQKISDCQGNEIQYSILC